MLARRASDVVHQPLGSDFVPPLADVSAFLGVEDFWPIFGSVDGYEGPDILRSSTAHFRLMGSDAGQVGQLRRSDRAYRVRNRPALRHGHLRVAQFRIDLLQRVRRRPRYPNPPKAAVGLS
jgi:hypothetical protein